jgi:hypothetical protein
VQGPPGRALLAHAKEVSGGNGVQDAQRGPCWPHFECSVHAYWTRILSEASQLREDNLSCIFARWSPNQTGLLYGRVCSEAGGLLCVAARESYFSLAAIFEANSVAPGGAYTKKVRMRCGDHFMTAGSRQIHGSPPQQMACDATLWRAYGPAAPPPPQPPALLPQVQKPAGEIVM